MGRPTGSLGDLATAIYEQIDKGEPNPTQALNLARLAAELNAVCGPHHQEVEERKLKAYLDLIWAIDTREMDEAAWLTGWYVRPEDIDSFR